MATNKLRAELEKLKQQRGYGGCGTCGRGSGRGRFIINLKTFTTVEEHKAQEAEADAEHKKRRCPDCGRLPLRIQLKGLDDKPRAKPKSRLAILND